MSFFSGEPFFCAILLLLRTLETASVCLSVCLSLTHPLTLRRQTGDNNESNALRKILTLPFSFSSFDNCHVFTFSKRCPGQHANPDTSKNASCRNLRQITRPPPSKKKTNKQTIKQRPTARFLGQPCSVNYVFCVLPPASLSSSRKSVPETLRAASCKLQANSDFTCESVVMALLGHGAIVVASGFTLAPSLSLSLSPSLTHAHTPTRTKLKFSDLEN